MSSFPTVRLRRLRRSPQLRALVRETRLSPDRFVTGFFVKHGKGALEEISALPGDFRYSPDEAVAEAQELVTLGISAAILFGIPDKKDDTGSEAWNDGAAVQETVRRLKKEVPGMLVVTDVCLDEYT